MVLTGESIRLTLVVILNPDKPPVKQMGHLIKTEYPVAKRLAKVIEVFYDFLGLEIGSSCQPDRACAVRLFSGCKIAFSVRTSSMPTKMPGQFWPHLAEGVTPSEPPFCVRFGGRAESSGSVGQVPPHLKFT